MRRTYLQRCLQENYLLSFMKTPSVDDLISQLQKICIQEATILQQLETVIVTECQDTTFTVGDRVRITNCIRLPRGTTVTHFDRYATITCIDRKMNKVHFKTDNGTKTWRLSKNLEGVLPNLY